jgi:hypothetical protein
MPARAGGGTMPGMLKHLTFANVLSVIAVVFALGGTSAYAANSVFSADIVDGEVKTVDLGAAAVTNNKLADNAVGGGKVVNDSLTGADINESTLDLPAATGGITTNRIAVPHGPAGQTVIAVPGLGEVRVALCSVKSSTTSFVNTTSGWVNVVRDTTGAGAGPSHWQLAPAQETGAAIEGTESSTYQVGLGFPGKVATVVVTAWTGADNCQFQAMAVTK